MTIRSSYKFYITLLLLFILLQPASILNAQVGGRQVYEFLDLSASARLSGLGDHLITVNDEDVALAYENPAVLNDTMSGLFTINHRFYLEDINHGYFAYGSKLPFYDLNMHAGLQYIRYGDFVASDIYGNKTGTFTANETALILGVSKQLNERISLGVNTKWIQSRLESYNSYGFGADLGLLYSIASSNTNLAFVIKNIGVQFNAYENIREPLPFDIQAGVSRKLKHLPFRFSILAHHLHRWNILYDDPNEENNVIFIGEGQEASKIATFTDNFFRHLIISGEFLIGKKENLSLRLGYNHLRRKELSVDNYISMAGFSLGFGLKIKKFKLDYAYSVYHLAGGTSHIGISMNVNQLINRF